MFFTLSGNCVFVNIGTSWSEQNNHILEMQVVIIIESFLRRIYIYIIYGAKKIK